MQKDAESRERYIAFEYSQLKAAEKKYPVHDKDLLAMKYAQVKFRFHPFGSNPFVIYTDQGALRTRHYQRIARWISLCAEKNFKAKYMPDDQNV